MLCLSMSMHQVCGRMMTVRKSLSFERRDRSRAELTLPARSKVDEREHLDLLLVRPQLGRLLPPFLASKHPSASTLLPLRLSRPDGLVRIAVERDGVSVDPVDDDAARPVHKTVCKYVMLVALRT